MSEPRSITKAAKYLLRAALLRCPVCGEKPLFIPWYRTRSLRDWFTPLDGCPRCGYPYEREPGYFLMSIWAVNYGVSSVLGITLYGILVWRFKLPVEQLLVAVLLPMVLFSVFFSRHAKAFFLAFDLFFDPHHRDGGTNDGGNRPLPPPSPLGSVPKGATPPPSGEQNSPV